MGKSTCCDAVLKTAGHKSGDGQQNAHNLIDHGLAGGTDPYGQAHKDVAQNATEEDGDGVDRNLTGGDAHHGVSDRLAVELVNGCHVNQKDNEQGTDKVADPHNGPGLSILTSAIFLLLSAQTISELPVNSSAPQMSTSTSPRQKQRPPTKR